MTLTPKPATRPARRYTLRGLAGVVLTVALGSCGERGMTATVTDRDGSDHGPGLPGERELAGDESIHVVCVERHVEWDGTICSGNVLP